ncbi:60S ribosomal protein L4-1 [Platanthera guangdongensis]|uniref:60S ribosomal protein L4-1 n=1 Tax=Platanthera guangdongensis TaxID=2320717 RepID=A0ABR2MC74_9ASPA
MIMESLEMHTYKYASFFPPLFIQEEATKIKVAGRAWYKTMISDSEYTEFENFSKWLGSTQ